MSERLRFEAPIVITLPRVMDGEEEALLEICKEPCPPIVHIRKPESSEREVEGLLDRLKASGCDMSRLTIHYNEPLARKYGLGGVHLRGAESDRDEAFVERLCNAKGVVLHLAHFDTKVIIFSKEPPADPKKSEKRSLRIAVPHYLLDGFFLRTDQPKWPRASPRAKYSPCE